MYRCHHDSDCRSHYACLSATELGVITTGYSIVEDAGTDSGIDGGVDAEIDSGIDGGVDAGTDADINLLPAPLAENLDNRSGKFCTVDPTTINK
jgi:hypothetical protein